MNLPKRNRHWLKECQKALSVAEKKAKTEYIDIHYLYRITPDLVIKERKVTNSDTIAEIKEYIEDAVKSDWELDGRSKNNYKFHFVWSYIYSHDPADMVDEMDADRVMEYVNENMRLFDT